ncbi:MAG: TolB family protein [Kordiimonas sp.]
MKLITAISLNLMTCTALNAQQMSADEPNNVGPLPATEIYLAPLYKLNKNYEVGTPQNITNHKGYDNQPYFLADSSGLMYTSEGVDVRTDIWLYSIEQSEKRQLTNTPNNSEYSPKLIPDGSGISVIRERENRGGQQVWRYSHSESTGGKALLNLSPTGYHAWGVGTDYLAVFVLGEPSTLQLVERSTGKTDIIFENIGRGLFSLPDGSGYTFTEPRADDTVLVYHFDIKSREVLPLFTLPKGNEFYTVMKNENAPLGVSFLSASDSTIVYKETASEDWQEIANYSNEGITGISRLAVSPNGKHIAIVAAE